MASVEFLLARITAKSPSFGAVGGGGIPQLTSSDVAAALGYVDGSIPDNRMGVHVVLARYCDDDTSRKILMKKNNLPKLAYLLWWELGLTSKYSIPAVYKTCEVALIDYCEPGRALSGGEVAIRKRIGVGYDSWANAHKRHYLTLMNRLYWLEDPVISVIMKALK